MNTRTKSILIYVGGIVTGIIFTFAFLYFLASKNTNGGYSDNIVLFEKPQQKINVKSFEIMQVFPNGNALATVEDFSNLGMVVLFLADNETPYYDDQKINVPTGKCVRQIGTYKYNTASDFEKTVPVIKIMDK